MVNSGKEWDWMDDEIKKQNKVKKNNPKWMKYWDNVNVGLYALIKQVKKNKNEN